MLGETLMSGIKMPLNIIVKEHKKNTRSAITDKLKIAEHIWSESN